HTHTHAHTHTIIHVLLHIHTHTHTHTRTHTHTHTHTHTQTHTQTTHHHHTHTHTHTHTGIVCLPPSGLTKAVMSLCWNPGRTNTPAQITIKRTHVWIGHCPTHSIQVTQSKVWWPRG